MSLVSSPMEKLVTGIPGFDSISDGGLPKHRTTLVSGTAGSAKTVFACHFLSQGIASGQPGVFVTFEETPEEIRQNVRGFGWDIEQWERDGKWAFVDASPPNGEKAVVVGDFDLGALLARIEYAIKLVGAERLAMDSLGAVFAHFDNATSVRAELLRIARAVKLMGVTAVMTAERTREYGKIARFGVEEFVADNVIILRNALEGEKRRRTIEILKFRGHSHQKGEYPFAVMPDEGIVVIPLSAIQLKQKSSDIRITSGSPELDRMCGGGFYRDSIILVSGATGAGKTLMVTSFLAGGAKEGERCLLFASEESREQLFRNARGWGVDFEKMENDGLLKVYCEYPEASSLEDQFIHMKKIITEFRPNRLAVDSLSALERVASPRSFREFVIGITSFIKHQEVAGLFTSNTPSLMGGSSVTEAHISTITDSIILLRYVEMFGEIRRGVTVLKMRGSPHEKDIREFHIDSQGIHIGHPFRNVTGILSGQPTHMAQVEVDRMMEMFKL